VKTDQPYALVLIAFGLPGYGNPEYAAVQILTNVLDRTRKHLHNLPTSGKALDVGFSSDFPPDAGIGYVLAVYSRLIRKIRWKTLDHAGVVSRENPKVPAF